MQRIRVPAAVFAAAACCALALLLAGCTRVETGVAVRADGSGEFSVTIAVREGAAGDGYPSAESVSEGMLRAAGAPPGARTEPYRDGEWAGLTARWAEPDAAAALGAFGSGWLFSGASLTREPDGGWRFEAEPMPAVAIPEELLDEAPEFAGRDLRELADGNEIFFRLSLPGRVSDHNADHEAGGMLHWMLPASGPAPASLFAVSAPDGTGPPRIEPPERPSPVPRIASAALARMSVNAEVRPPSVAADYEFVFRNDAGSGPAEGRVVFPLPDGASAGGLVLAGGDAALEGRLLPADEAAALYGDIVRRLADPALLRSLGGSLYEARVFPVPPGEARSVRFRVTAPLEAAGGDVFFEVPWQRMSPLPRAASVRVEADLPRPIRAAIAPGFAAAVSRAGPGGLAVSWESPPGWDAAASGFRLRLIGGEGIAAARLFSYRERGEDGYFALVFAPPLPASAERAPRDVVIALDRSGSMGGDKFAQAVAAAGELLDGLDGNDRFGAVAFADDPEALGGGLRPAAERGAARTWLRGLAPAGGTNVEAALTAALSMLGRERPGAVVFLTDGLPTAGDASAAGILAAAGRAAPGNRTQLFAFGVGYDVDTVLLDSLSARFAGSSHYVLPGERIDGAVGALARRIATPVLTGVRVSVRGAEVSELAPAELRGLFAGEAALLTGRYSGSGEAVVRVTGTGADGPLEEKIRVAFPRLSSGDPAVARLWAQRRVADLLTDLRLGEADGGAAGRIVSIANRFGIVTPYTSYLADEPELVFEPDAAAERVEAAAGGAASGADAVAAAAAVGSLRDGGREPPPAAAGEVRVAGAHAWYRRGEDGWARDDWRGEPAREVIAGSDEFADLIRDPASALAAAVGERVVTLGPEGWIAIVWPAAGGEPPPSAAPEPASGSAATPADPAPPSGGAASAAPAAPAAPGAARAETDARSWPRWALAAFACAALAASALAAGRIARTRREAAGRRKERS